MLYVHSLMGDARPGEIAPSALGPAVTKLYDRIAAATARYRGPYRIGTQVPRGLVVGKAATATVRVVSATGAPMAGIVLSVTGKGVDGLPGRVRTDAAGVARFELTPASATGAAL